MKIRLSCFLLAALMSVSACWVPAQALEFSVDMIQLDPWTQPDPNNAEQYVGIVPEVIQELEKRTGYKIKRKMAPYGRVELDLEYGVIDFSFMAWGPQRAVYANKGATGFPLEFGVIARKGVALKTYADLKGMKISVTRGLKVDPGFDVDNGLDKSLDLDYTIGVRKAEVGRVDAIAGALPSMRYVIGKLGLREQFGDVLTLKTTDAGISFSKKSPNIAHEALINDTLKQIVKDGTMKKIQDKWLKN